MLNSRCKISICRKQHVNSRQYSPCNVNERKFAPHLSRLAVSGSIKLTPDITISTNTRIFKLTMIGVTKYPSVGTKMENTPVSQPLVAVGGAAAASASASSHPYFNSAYFSASSSELRFAFNSVYPLSSDSIFRLFLPQSIIWLPVHSLLSMAWSSSSFTVTSSAHDVMENFV